MALLRILKHLIYPGWLSHRRFPQATMDRIEAAIAASEREHHGEIRFAVETNLDLLPLWRDQTPRQRALAVFAEQGVWDTEANNGVLLYLLLADRQVEIVADRDLARRVPETEWQSLCERMRTLFAQGRYEQGVLQGVAGLHVHLTRHYPRQGEDVNELPNRPVRL